MKWDIVQERSTHPKLCLGASPGLENLISLSTWRASLCQLGVFETNLGEGYGRHAATTVNRLALHKLSDEIF